MQNENVTYFPHSRKICEMQKTPDIRYSWSGMTPSTDSRIVTTGN